MKCAHMHGTGSFALNFSGQGEVLFGTSPLFLEISQSISDLSMTPSQHSIETSPNFPVIYNCYNTENCEM